MNHRKLRKDTRGVTKVLFIILIVVLLLSASSVVILLSIGQNATPARKVAVGDTIKVNYIGKLADGRVFDTSYLAVATNDALYPKSLSFGLRDNASYTPLQFIVGSGNLIKGFESGVVGMTLNQTKTFSIPPNLGYGPLNTSRLLTFNLTETEPVFQVMNQTLFHAKYNVTPEIFLSLIDPFWGWSARVISFDPDADVVRVQNMPSVGDRLAVYGTPNATIPTGWYADVISIDSTVNDGAGAIEIHHLLTAADEKKVQGADFYGNFIVDQIDPTSGIARKNYNDELLGVNIYFTVTLYAFVD